MAALELQIRGVSKTYANGVHALKDVTLTIPRGMYGLLGPNGAGKSTLMRMLATLQEPDSGTIALGPSTASGQAIDVIRQKDEIRQTLGYLPQEFAATCINQRALVLSSPSQSCVVTGRRSR